MFPFFVMDRESFSRAGPQPPTFTLPIEFTISRLKMPFTRFGLEEIRSAYIVIFSVADLEDYQGRTPQWIDFISSVFGFMILPSFHIFVVTMLGLVQSL